MHRLLRGAALAIIAGLTGATWAQEPDAGMPASNPLASVTAESLSAFRTRPLFVPTRAEAPTAVPMAPPPHAAAAPPPEPPALKLVGIVGGKVRMAVVRLGGGGAHTLVTGDKLDAWTVTVLETGMRIEAGDQRIEIGLFKPSVTGKQPHAPTDFYEEPRP